MLIVLAAFILNLFLNLWEKRNVVEGLVMFLMLSVGVLTYVFGLQKARESPYVHVALGSEVKGLITFKDIVNPQSGKVVRELKSMGFKVLMLTGDLKNNAERVTEELGIEEFYAELNPEDKVKIVKSLKEGARITVVGDGINGAPALAVADVGIAIGSLQAMAEATDVAIVTNNVSEVVSFFKLSRKGIEGLFEV